MGRAKPQSCTGCKPERFWWLYWSIKIFLILLCRWWQQSLRLDSMLRQWHTRTWSSKFGILEDRPAFDLTGGAITPTPMQSYTSSTVQTGADQYRANTFHTFAAQSYTAAQSLKDLIYDFFGAMVVDRKWKCWMGQYYRPCWRLMTDQINRRIFQLLWRNVLCHY